MVKKSGRAYFILIHTFSNLFICYTLTKGLQTCTTEYMEFSSNFICTLKARSLEVAAVSGLRIVLPDILRSFTNDEGLESLDRHWDMEYSKACLKGGEWVMKLKLKLTLTFCHRRCGPTKNRTLFDVENGTWAQYGGFPRLCSVLVLDLAYAI